jgi:hypothetical protein
MTSFQITGEPLIRRADDNPDTLKTRLMAYHNQTHPLVQFYRSRSLHQSVDAALDTNTVFSNITAIFERAKSECRGRTTTKNGQSPWSVTAIAYDYR